MIFLSLNSKGMEKMYSFIEGEYPNKEEIVILEEVSIEALSYPEDDYNHLFQIEEHSFWFQHRNQCIEKVIQAYPSKELIDVGGGNGYVTWYLQKKGYDVILLEPSMQGCLNAKKRGVKKIICGLMQETSIKPNTLESVCLFDVLEHIEDDRAFLKNIHSHMKANGRLYLTVPAFSKLWSKEDDEAGHFRRYELEGITQLLKESGFKIEFSNYFFSFLYVPIWMIRVVGGKLREKRVKEPKKEKTIRQQHEGYYQKIKPIVDFLTKKEQEKLSFKSIKRGSSLIIVAKANAE